MAPRLAEVALNNDSPPLPTEKVELFTLWTRWH